MKAILVLDEVPKDCSECELRGFSNETDDPVCCANGFPCNYSEMPDWCPLRPLPERKRTDHLAPPDSFAPGELDIFLSGFLDGFNRCLDEIRGGGNE